MGSMATRRQAATMANLQPVVDWLWDSLDRSHVKNRNSLAAAAGYPKTIVYSWFAGRIMPSLTQLGDLADAMGVSKDPILGIWKSAVEPRSTRAASARDWNPSDFGVHDAIVAPMNEHLPSQPLFVKRAHDVALREILKTATSASLVLVDGESCTGKTRSAFEAMVTESPEWNVASPQSIDSLVEFIDAGNWPGNTILWLDDIHWYLLAKDSRLVESLLSLLSS